MNDAALLEQLHKEQDTAYQVLYLDYYPVVVRYVMANNGTQDDAADLFQDLLLVLVNKLRSDHFELTAKLKTYILAIAKNLWLKRLRNSHWTLSVETIQDQRFMQEMHQAIEQERSLFERIQFLLPKITKHCQQMIDDIFFKDKSIDEIQQQYGYTSRHNAQNQKHKCVEQIRKVNDETKME